MNQIRLTDVLVLPCSEKENDSNQPPKYNNQDFTLKLWIYSLSFKKIRRSGNNWFTFLFYNRQPELGSSLWMGQISSVYERSHPCLVSLGNGAIDPGPPPG